MTALTSSLVVKLIDGISAPAKGAAKALAGIGEAALRINGTGIGGVQAKLSAMAKANEAQMEALRGRMVDAAAMGYTLGRALNAPLAEARGFESVLLDIGQKANLSDDRIARLGKSIGALSVNLKKTLSQTDLAKGVDFLAGMGLDPDRALTMLEPIGRAAHAYRADVEDLARAGYAAFDNLKVPAEQFGRALDTMAQSGKEGAFELRDMARYFPSLGATFQGLGQTGVGAVADLAAALQVARKGAGDSEQAATNLANVLQKIAAPATVKNFRKFGIDIRKELEKAQKTGKSPIEMIAEQTNKALKGNLALMGDLFEDAQVQGGLRALILNLEEYRRIRDEALRSDGVVDGDFARRLLTGDAALEQFANRMADLGRTIGTILLPTVNELLGAAGKWTSAVAELAEKHPNLAKGVIALTAAVTAFRVAAIGAAFAGRFMLGGALTGAVGAVGAAGKLKGLGVAMFAPFALLGAKLKGVGSQVRSAFAFWRVGAATAAEAASFAFAGMGAAMLRVLNPLRLVTAAFRVLRLAVIGTGIGAALIGIAMAGEWIYNNWEGIGVAFEAFKGAFDRAIGPVKGALEPVLSSFSAVFGWIDQITGALDNGTWASWGIAAGAALGGLVVSATQTVQQIVATFQGLPAAIAEKVRGVGQAIYSALFEVDYAAAGAQIIRSLRDGVIGAMSELVGWIRSSIAGAFSGIGGGMAGAAAGAPRNSAYSAPGTVDVPVGGGSGQPPARARGGRVQQGEPYRVNDDGSRDPWEIFVPGRSGTVLPSSERRKLEGGGGAAPGGGTFAPTLHFHVAGGDAEAIASEAMRKLRDLHRDWGRFSDLKMRGA